MTLILTILLIFFLLVLSELWWRTRRPHDEFSRKFIHIFVGSLVAFAPYYLSWWQIVTLGAGFIGVVSISKFFNIFQSIHAVERPTWGEVFFALAVGLLAFMTHEPWIYTAALLHMSLADGLAAIIGVTWGDATRYKVLGHTKSIIGTATFFAVSLLILAAYSAVAAPLSLTVIVSLAFVTTVIENIGIAGSDNLLVPVVVAGILSSVG